MRRVLGKVRNFIFSWAFLVFVLCNLTGASATAIGFTLANQHQTNREYNLPARFEAQGVLTLGCSLWSVPSIVPYSDSNEKTGFFAIEANNEEALMIFDGPKGTYMVDGMKCGMSIDYSGFPLEVRPVPTDKENSANAKE